MQKSIDIKEALQFGWTTLRNQFTFFLKVLAVLIVISILPAIAVNKVSAAAGPILGIPLQFLNLAWQAILGMGVVKICLKLHDRRTVEIPDLWSCAARTLDYVIVKVLFALIVILGLLLLVVPGCVWFLQFYMASYLVVDRGDAALAALKRSSAITDGAKGDLAAFTAVMLAINLAGLLFFGVGVLITMPVTLLASVFVYRKLLDQTGASA